MIKIKNIYNEQGDIVGHKISYEEPLPRVNTIIKDRFISGYKEAERALAKARTLLKDTFNVNDEDLRSDK